jgi:hypothetical protein
MADIGILTKNYKVHLDSAIQSGCSVTFYSNSPWVKAANALTSGKSVDLYFVVDGGSGTVEYQGTLDDIILAPVENTDAAEKLLVNAPDEAAREGVNSGVVKTLYSVTHLRKLETSFSQTELLKLNGEPVNKAYDRAYCLVHPYE